MLWFIIIPILIYVFVAFLLLCFQHKMVFLPVKTIFATPDEVGMKYDNLFIEVNSNCSDKRGSLIASINSSDIPDIKKSDFYGKINCWFIYCENSVGTVLFCHGNAGTMSHRIESAQIFHSLGLNVVLFDYRGYGLSPGIPSEKQTYEDADAVWRYLTQVRGIPENKIIILGRSMGGPIAAKLAKDVKPVLCILESTFTSIPDVGQARFPIFPTKLLVKINYPTIDYIKKIQSPVFLVHSKNDEIIHYRMGEKLFKEANAPKEFVSLSGGHNETYFECIEQYKANLERTIRQYLL